MAAEKPTAATANLFTPSGWAFAIWGPIFLGEWLMMLYLTNVPSAATLGAAAAPGWCAATAAQVAWCAAFRPSVCGPSMLWVPAALLAATGVGLGVAHRAIRNVGHSGAANALVRALASRIGFDARQFKVNHPGGALGAALAAGGTN